MAKASFVKNLCGATIISILRASADPIDGVLGADRMRSKSCCVSLPLYRRSSPADAAKTRVAVSKELSAPPREFERLSLIASRTGASVSILCLFDSVLIMELVIAPVVAAVALASERPSMMSCWPILASNCKTVLVTLLA
jgi:hypothetical protein